MNTQGQTTPGLSLGAFVEQLGQRAPDLPEHRCEAVEASQLILPGPDFVDRVWSNSDRCPAVLRSMQQTFGHGRLGGTGYLSILPVDQGFEHSGGASFAPNPAYFDPEQVIQLAINAGFNAAASMWGVLGSVARKVARKYAHKIPFIVTLNHNKMDRTLIERLALVGVWLTIGTLGVFYWVVQMGGSTELARVLALTTLILFQKVHVFNCRSEDTSIFKISLFSNTVLLIGVLTSLLLHIGALYLPWTQTLLGFQPLPWQVWIAAILVASTAIIVNELHKWLRPRNFNTNNHEQEES